MPRIKPSQALKQMRILYVEDEDSIRESFAMLLKRNVRSLITAENGHQGWKYFQENPVDIVISDINMPVMNGLEMAQRIKQQSPNTLVVFTTAFSDTDYLKRSIEIGIDAYLIKPIDINKVYEKLNELAQKLIIDYEVKQYQQLLQSILNEDPNILIVLDIHEDYKIKLSNQAFKESAFYPIYQQAKTKPNENPIEAIIQHLCYEQEEQIHPLKLNILTQIETETEQLLLFKPDNQEDKTYYYKTIIKKLLGALLIRLIDQTEFCLQQKLLKSEIVTDALTGVYNRKILTGILPQLKQQETYAILLDIDNFKKINDTYGHQVGDKVLIQLAQTLKKVVRNKDIVLRWGGEEFLILLHGITTPQTAVTIAEKLRQTINQTTIPPIGHFSCSFGVAHTHISTEKDLDTLFEQADQALYYAKGHGKNQVILFDQLQD